MKRWQAWLFRRTDGASVAAFRILFGLTMLATAVRSIAHGWVEQFYVERTFHFKYWGFEWVQALPYEWMNGAFVLLGLLGLFVALGLYCRIAAVLFFCVFTYVELIDVTNYLNHYYLVSLLALTIAVLPTHGLWSLDAWRRRRGGYRADDTVPFWTILVVRFQIGIVYVFAAIAKMGPDWLIEGQPLGLWLAARTDVPIIGPLFDLPWVAVAMSWAGFLNDLFAVPLLLWKKTRAWMYGVLLTFHLGTALLFNIGMFPFIMMGAATVLLSPSWPRRLVRNACAPPRTEPSRPGRMAWVCVGLAALVAIAEVAVPARALFYSGDVLWHEQGMRWSWRVKVREKNGSVLYRVHFPETGDTRWIEPRRYLTRYQEQEMSGQPDLIAQLARRIGRDFQAQGHRSVQVYAEAWASLNGRRRARLIDQEQDLMLVHDGLTEAKWISRVPHESL